MKLRMQILFIASMVLVAPPGDALMQFFGAGSMGVSSGWPKGLDELINCDARVAGAFGPIADCTGYYTGDTARLNAFLKAYAGVPNALSQVVLHAGHRQLEMKRYDNTERVVTIDWSLSISEHTPGRANALEFEGKMALTRLEIWLGGQIDLDALDVPADLEVRSGDEIEAFIKRHTEKRKRPDTNK